MAREHRRDDSNLDRRGYLKATGAALLGTAVGAGATATTARAATAVSDNWQIRNRYIETGSDENGIGCAVTDPDGEGVIEHVYIRSTASSDSPAIWVDPNRHVGHLTIRNVHIEGHADNAIYSENAPPHGAGGTVTIEDCYLHDNTRGNLRINGGTEVRNTHIHNTGENFPTHGYVSTGYLSFYEGQGEITMRHCQIEMDGSNTRSGSGATALMTRSRSNVPTVNVHDSQVKGEVSGHGGNIDLHDSGSDPTIDPPKGVPMTAEEAENGTSSATGPTWDEVSGGDGDSGSETESEESEDDQQGTVLELVAADDAQGVEYEFTVDGEVAKHTVDADVAAEGNDSVTENGDGTATVTGASGNGYGDAFLVDGAITSMNLDESDWTLRYGGEQATVADLTESGSDSGSGDASETEDLPNTLVLDGTDAPRTSCTYEFAVTGDAAKDGDLGSINAFDEVGDGVISGRVIQGRDAYRFDGEITEFRVDGPVSVRLETRS